MDRRIKYTRMVLNESLLKFLEQKEITKITVTEICADADVNRSTYYAHFTDPFDQLAQMKSQILNDVAEFSKQIDAEHLPTGQRQYKVLKALLQYIEAKRQVFQILLAKSGDRNMQQEILTLLGEKVFPLDIGQDEHDTRSSYHLIYASNGCFGMFYHWLMSENPISSDELAHLMADFTKNVVKQMRRELSLSSAL